MAKDATIKITRSRHFPNDVYYMERTAHMTGYRTSFTVYGVEELYDLIEQLIEARQDAKAEE